MMNLTELGANAQQFLKAHSSERVSRWFFVVFNVIEAE